MLGLTPEKNPIEVAILRFLLNNPSRKERIETLWEEFKNTQGRNEFDYALFNLVENHKYVVILDEMAELTERGRGLVVVFPVMEM